MKRSPHSQAVLLCNDGRAEWKLERKNGAISRKWMKIPYWPPFYGENLPLDDWVTTGLKPSWERVRSTLRNEATWRLDIDKLSTCKPTQQDIFSFHFIRNSFQKRQNMLGIKADFQNSSESKKCYLLQSLVLITHKSVMCSAWEMSRPSLAKSPKSE